MASLRARLTRFAPLARLLGAFALGAVASFGGKALWDRGAPRGYAEDGERGGHLCPDWRDVSGYWDIAEADRPAFVERVERERAIDMATDTLRGQLPERPPERDPTW